MTKHTAMSPSLAHLDATAIFAQRARVVNIAVSQFGQSIDDRAQRVHSSASLEVTVNAVTGTWETVWR